MAMMRSPWLWLALPVVGCSFHHGELGGDGRALDDRPIDMSGEMQTDARQCWSVAQLNVNVCLTAPPSGTVTVSSNTSIDTNMTGGGPLQCKQLQLSTSTSGLWRATIGVRNK